MAQEKLSGSVKKTTLLIDWIVIAILLVVGNIVRKINPKERQFSLDDVSISHPRKEDTISMTLLFVSYNFY